MKDPNGFDELARQKLAERDHAFDPAHWADMERLLRERDRKPKAWWPWMAAGLLLMGGSALWSVTDKETASVPSPNGTVAEQVEGSSTTSETTATVQVSSSTQAITGTDTQPERPEASPEKETVAEAIHAPRGSASSAGRSDVARPRPNTVLTAYAHDGMAVISPVAAIDPERMRPSTMTPADSMAPDETPASDNPASSSDPSGPVNDPVVTMAPNASEIPGTVTPENTNIVDPRTDMENTVVPELVEQPLEPAIEKPAAPSTTTTEPSGSGTETPVPAIVEPNPAPPAPPEWLAVRTPFELSLMGGAFSTTSDYRGRGTETWQASTERQNTPGFGLEGVWNISTHFGLGIGAHYTSYKERLVSGELHRTDEILSNNYFWISHDTMVLTVVDTVVIGATEYFVTELVPMTINELGIDTDTTYSTTLLRERRSVVNAVNYVEIPLLLDAHTSCGRWVFGVRGGPTVGLLTSKQGSIPGEGEAGYADLNERTFSSMTLGATARAYARYRLSSAWSIGLEPTWRQQLGNAFGDADVQRRGNAFGGYLSLSYRFAPKSVVP